MGRQHAGQMGGLPGGGDLIALSEELDAMGVKVDKKIVEDNSLIMMILSYALMIGGLDRKSVV